MPIPRFRRHIVGAVALLVPALVVHAEAANAQSRTPTSTRPPSTSPTPARADDPAPAPMDTTPVAIVLYQDDVIAFVDQPTEHLIAARGALARGDNAAAARELGAAAAYMRVQSGYAAGADRSDMLEAARDVDRLAVDARTRKLRTTDELDDALGRADRVLARHHWERAMRAWERRDAAKTGLELRAAANATERATRVVGRDADEGAKAVVVGARTLSGQLIDGAGWTVDEVGKGVADLGRVIERLGREVEPRRR